MSHQWQRLLHFEGNSGANAEKYLHWFLIRYLNMYLDIGDIAYKIYPLLLTRCRIRHCCLDHQDNHLMNNKSHYYSFKIFPRFWLVKTTRIINHKQLLLTKNSVILNQWRQKCSPLQIIEPLTSKWRQKCSPLQIIESLTSKIIEPLTEKTWGQGSVIQQREKWPRGVYKFERR